MSRQQGINKEDFWINTVSNYLGLLFCELSSVSLWACEHTNCWVEVEGGTYNRGLWKIQNGCWNIKIIIPFWQCKFNLTLENYYMSGLCGTTFCLHMKLTFYNFNIYNIKEYMYGINVTILGITKVDFNSLLALEKNSRNYIN